MTSSSRRLLVPLCAFLLSACGSSPSFDTGPDDTGVAGDTSSGGDTANGGDTSNGGDTTPGGDTRPGGDTSPASDTPAADAPGTDTAPTCAAGTPCGGSCVDTRTDPLNCGACGLHICHDEVCTDSKPACYPGFKACGGASPCLGCRDIQADPENCGDCGRKCGTGQACVSGACVVVAGGCGGGLTGCGSPFGTPRYCTNTDTDPANCGGCLKQCAPTQFCSGGTCIDYTGAPGCSSCPCSTCSDPTSKCCSFAGSTICATDCP